MKMCCSDVIATPIGNRNPRATLKRLMAERHPVYAEADIVVDAKDVGPEATARQIVEALKAFGVAGKEARP